MKELDYYLRLEYPFRVEPDPEGGFVASIPDLPGCYTSAETKQKVLERLEETKTAWLESYYAMHGGAPEPNTPANFSGRVLLRLPKYLHKTLHDGAKDEGVSVNQYLVALLADGASRAEHARTSNRSPGLQATGIQRHVRKEVSEVAIGIPRAKSRKMAAMRKHEERESRGLRIGESPGEFPNATKRKKSNHSRTRSKGLRGVAQGARTYLKWAQGTMEPSCLGFPRSRSSTITHFPLARSNTRGSSVREQRPQSPSTKNSSTY